jgi:putative component of toxin-antitoxin plasmid stabilization module
MDQEILKVFFYDVQCAAVMHFSAWSSSLRWRRMAVRRRLVRLYFINVGHLQLSSGNSAPNSGKKD